ncbi:uncharacterized protein [Spinacia oleracea]|uniref:Uncharacterized protein n=1 Tax=Spinacia oleracea TaxID=3562 RepID=A0ABM3RR59_SPIOL|nr:uncharacterized protein LOC130471807 [Spinacia oleracea]
MVFKKGHTGSNKQWVPGTSNRKKYMEPEIDEDDEEYEEDLVGSGDDSEDTPYEEEGEELEDEEEDDDEYVDEDDEGENDVGVKSKLKNQGRKTGNAKGRRPVVVEEDDEFYDELEVDAGAKSKMKERSRKYAKSRRLVDVEDEENDDEEDDEEDGEADVRRVGKKHPKHVGHNVRRGYPEDEQHGLRKKHLKVIRKRRQGDTDDEEE